MRIFFSSIHCLGDSLQRRPVRPGAVHLAALHREMDLRRRLVAGDDLELPAEQLLRQFRIVVLRRARRLRADDHLLGGEIGQRLDRRRVPDIHRLGLAVGAADPVHLDCLEARAGRLQQRRGRQAVERSADRGAVERPRGIKLVGHAERARARLVLHDDAWIAGNVFRQIAGQQPRVDVVARADADADDQAHHLALVEGGDIVLRRSGQRRRAATTMQRKSADRVMSRAFCRTTCAAAHCCA